MPHLVRRLNEREIGVVRHDRLREGNELHALATQLDDLPDNPVHGAVAAVENRADLHGGGFDDGHGAYPFLVDCRRPLFGNRHMVLVADAEMREV